MLAHKTNLELHLLLMRVGLHCQLNLWGLIAMIIEIVGSMNISAGYLLQVERHVQHVPCSC